VFENRVRRKIFGANRDEVTREWRKLHYEEKLNDLYSSPNIFRVIKSRRMRWVGHVALMGERRGVCMILVGKPEGKTRCRWKDNIKVGYQLVGCRGIDWMELAQDRDSWRAVVNAVVNLRVPKIVRNFLTSWKPVSFSRRTLLHGVGELVTADVAFYNKFMLIELLYNKIKLS